MRGFGGMMCRMVGGRRSGKLEAGIKESLLMGLGRGKGGWSLGMEHFMMVSFLMGRSRGMECISGGMGRGMRGCGRRI